jgi:hypothetical protein
VLTDAIYNKYIPTKCPAYNKQFENDNKYETDASGKGIQQVKHINTALKKNYKNLRNWGGTGGGTGEQAVEPYTPVPCYKNPMPRKADRSIDCL